MPRTIVRKFLVTQGIAILLSMLLLGGGSFYMLYSELDAAVQQELLVLSDQLGNRLEADLKEISGIMERIETLDFHKNYRVPALAKHLAKFHQTLPLLSWSDQVGVEEVKVVNGQSVDQAGNLAANPWFQKALVNPQQVYYHGPLDSPELQVPVVEFVTARFDYFGDTFMGVLRSEVPMREFTEILEQQIGQSDFICLIDGSNKIIFSSQAAPLAQLTGSFAALPGARQVAWGNLVGVDGLNVWTEVDGVDWTLLIVMPRAEFMNVPLRALLLTLVIGGFALIAGLLLAYRMARPMVRNISQLDSHTREIAAGNLASRVEIHSNDELESLGASVNQMTVNLARSTNSLECAVDEAVILSQQAQTANRVKSQFLANMSHEIRTPMNGVLGVTEMVLAGELQDSQRDLIRTIQSSAETLMIIINDILDFSKIEAGKLEIEKIDFNLHELIAGVVQTLSCQDIAAGLEIDVAIAADVPLWVNSDPGRIRQILVNLLSNALKFSVQGEVWVALDLVANHPDVDEIRFSIKDNGIGISDEEQKSLFQPFTQADGSTTRKYGGTGLGLAISKQLSEMLGGRIDCYSRAGQGATFWFDLPLGRAVQADTLRCEATVDPDSSGHSAQSFTATVLLVEDNQVNQLIFEAALKKLGCEVDSVNNGAEAVEQSLIRGYDLILMDCQMPVMDGYQATALIRQREQGGAVPIVALTANALSGDRQKCLDAGMNDYLSKPCTQDEIAMVLQEWLAPR